jgi:hypothetical protein
VPPAARPASSESAGAEEASTGRSWSWDSFMARGSAGTGDLIPQDQVRGAFRAGKGEKKNGAQESAFRRLAASCSISAGLPG